MDNKPEHHKVKVVRIPLSRTHTNAESLELLDVMGYQVVVKKGDFNVGDLAYFVPPDNLVPERPEYQFLWSSIIQPDGTFRDGMKEVPIKYRRIKAKKLRGQWSEGLLMPLPEAWKQEELGYSGIHYSENQDVSDLLGITHYEPPEPTEFGGQNEKAPSRPKTLKGWLYFIKWRILRYFGLLPANNEKPPNNTPPFYDVENIKHYNVFEPGEEVVVTEKLHGCQGRYVYRNGHMYAGSRKLWKALKSKNIWRKAVDDNPWIYDWCKENEGYTLYGELLPCQGEKFQYGIEKGLTKFFVFDILTPGHDWMTIKEVISQIVNRVPLIYSGPFDTDKMKTLASGVSHLDIKTIREGIVIKPAKERHVRGLGRLNLKLINNTFLEKS